MSYFALSFPAPKACAKKKFYVAFVVETLDRQHLKAVVRFVKQALDLLKVSRREGRVAVILFRRKRSSIEVKFTQTDVGRIKEKLDRVAKRWSRKRLGKEKIRIRQALVKTKRLFTRRKFGAIKRNYKKVMVLVVERWAMRRAMRRERRYKKLIRRLQVCIS